MFYNKNGALSAYGLACGKIQLYDRKLGKAELYKEGGVYHTRVIIKGFEAQQWNKDDKKAWLSFEKLSDARKAFVHLCQIADEGEYTNKDEFWPSRRWNSDHTDYIDLSGHDKNWPWCTAFAHSEIA